MENKMRTCQIVLSNGSNEVYIRFARIHKIHDDDGMRRVWLDFIRILKEKLRFFVLEELYKYDWIHGQRPTAKKHSNFAVSANYVYM
jgi:hypothetical protein